MKYPKLKRIRKVCFITTVRFDLAPRAIRECRALSEKYSIEVIEFDSSKSLPKSAINGKVIFKRVRPKFWPKSRLLKFFFLMSAMIPEVIRSQAEVYHSFGFVELFLGAIAKITNGSKLVYDSYESYPYQYSGIKDRKTLLKSFVWSFIVVIEKIESKVCNIVLVVPSFRNELSKRFESMGKVVFTIWNVPYEQKNEETMKALDKHSFTCLYTGRISKDTGVVALLAAFRIAKKQFEGLKLVLIGRLDLDNITCNELLSTSKEFGDLVLLKAVSHDKLESLYLSADAGLAFYPPTYWTFRTKASEKVFEYMSFSLPVITSNFPGLREIINSTQSGLLVNPSNPESISNAILLLCRNQQYSKLLGTNGRKAIANNYNWDKQKVTLFEAYYYLEHGYSSP